MIFTDIAAEYLLRLRKFDSFMINAFTLVLVAVIAGNAAAGDWVAVAELARSAMFIALALAVAAFLYPAAELAGEWAWGRWDLPRVEVRR